MKWSGIRVIVVVVAIFTYLFSVPATGDAEVYLNIGFNFPLPVYTIPAPPSVVVIPGTYVYYVPDAPVEIFFYQGYWYRPYRNYWYRAAFYNGPWVTISPSRIPNTLVNVHPGYRGINPYYRPIPYVQLKNNWRHWERERYWDRHAERDWHRYEKERQKSEWKEQKEHKGNRKHWDD